mmetsp:Transcript_437/g.933  ORF Transcript_437/g.933 Transcript_437/m.933 type:complete len:266 (-) Transcript_437:249-1046(-)
MDAVHARVCLSVDLTGRLALHRRHRRMGAALLEVCAAPLRLGRMPGMLFPGAVVLDAALLLMRAAPILLGVRPVLHVAFEPGGAVIDVPLSMANAVHHVHVQVVASMPRAGATTMLVSAAPSFLMVRPAEVPVRVAGMAIVGKVVHDWCRRDVTGLVDNVAWGRNGDGNVVVVRWRGNRIGHFLVNHVTLHMVMGARTTVLIATGGLLLRRPEVLPVMVSFVAIQCGLHVVCAHGCAMREEPPQKAQSGEKRRQHEARHAPNKAT